MSRVLRLLLKTMPSRPAVAYLVLCGYVVLLTAPQPQVASAQVSSTDKNYTVSRYVNDVIGAIALTRSDAMGCEQGRRGEDGLVILAFGQPRVIIDEITGLPAAYRVKPPAVLEPERSISLSRAAELSIEFLSGWLRCSTGLTPTPRLYLAPGVNNCGVSWDLAECETGDVSFGHGKAWREQVIYVVDDWIGKDHLRERIGVFGAIDIETNWDTALRTKNWLDGFGNFPLVNFGSCDLCGYPQYVSPPDTPFTYTPPSGGPQQTCAVPPFAIADTFSDSSANPPPMARDWTKDNQRAVAFGDPGNRPNIFTIPQIYVQPPGRCANAHQWQALVQGWHPEGTDEFLRGVITQQDACFVRPEPRCVGAQNPPAHGWAQLNVALNQNPGALTSNGWLDYTTDITWREDPVRTPLQPRPALPRAVALDSSDHHYVRIRWEDASSNEANFQVRWTDDNEASYYLATLPANTSSWSDGPFAYLSQLRYWVRACNDGGGCSDWTGPVDVTLVGLSASPSNFRVSAATNSSLTLAWQDDANDETHFDIARQPWGGTGYTFESFPPDSNGWTHTGLTAGTTFYYWIRSCTYVGCGPWSVALTATTTGGSAPATPTNFRLGTVTTNSVQTLWDDVATETRYELVWTMYGTSDYVAVSLPANSTSWTHPSLDSGWTYYYWVRACIGGALCSPFTDAVEAITNGGSAPSAPTNLRLGEVTPDRIELRWDDTSSTELTFQVASMPVDGACCGFAEVPADSPRWVHANLPISSSCYYWVQSCIGALCSGWVGAVQGTTLGGGGGNSLVAPSSRSTPASRTASGTPVFGPNTLPAMSPPSQALARAAQAPPRPTADQLPKPV